MSVSSRSIKTAGDVASFMFVVVSKTADELISRHRRRSKFAHHYSTSVISNFRRFKGSCAADQAEREQRNCRIACAGHIENLTSLRPNIVRWCVLLKEHHPVFTQGDQDILRL